MPDLSQGRALVIAVKLTAEEKKALLAIENGADVTGYDIARTLRGIHEKAPWLVEIGPVMGKHHATDRNPYFGAIATAAGLKAARARS